MVVKKEVKHTSRVVKPKVAILELYRHFEVLRPLLIQINEQYFEVHVFVQSDFKTQVDPSNHNHFNWHLFPNSPLTARWFSQIPDLSQFDLVLVLTAVSHFNLFNKILERSTYFLIVHNVTPTFFPTRWSLQGASVKDVFGGLKYLIRSKGLRPLLQNAAGIGFLHDQIISNLPTKIRHSHAIQNGPPIFYRGDWIPPTWHPGDNKNLRIVIPGTIKKRGRNYQTIVRALELLSREIRDNLQIIFLGVSTGRHASQTLKTFRGLVGQVIAFTKPLTINEYDQHFASAHLCLCPFAKWYRLGLHRDEFGKHSISGLMNDLIFYGTPAFVSQYHPLPEEISPQIIRFESAQDLAKKIDDFYENGWPRNVKFHPDFNQRARATQLHSWIQHHLLETHA